MKNMHRVSDEDFDKLFQEKLYSYEAIPTDAVWSSIARDLKPVGKERSFPILRVAAASLASVIGLGIWLAANKEPMRLSAGSVTSSAVEKKTVAPAVLKKTEVKQDRSVKPVELALKPARAAANSASLRIVKAQTTVSKVREANLAAQSKNEVSRVSLAKQPERIENSVSMERPVQDDAAVLALAEQMPQEEDLTIRDKKIKSVGGLVNFVVGKIDKRKSKIIEFEDGDEGTKVSGLNLGLLKFKAKE